MIKQAKTAKKLRPEINNLVLAGGVALNCVANGKLLREKIFDNIWIQPAAGDAGGAMGAALFFWYQFLNKPRIVDDKKDSQKGEVSTHNIIAGSLLNRPYKEYYVMAFNSKSKDAIVYETYINTYESKDKSLNVYILDLDNSLNKKYVNEKSNSKAAKIEDLQIKGPTLMKVNDGPGCRRPAPPDSPGPDG